MAPMFHGPSQSGADTWVSVGSGRQELVRRGQSSHLSLPPASLVYSTLHFVDSPNHTPGIQIAFLHASTLLPLGSLIPPGPESSELSQGIQLTTLIPPRPNPPKSRFPPNGHSRRKLQFVQADYYVSGKQKTYRRFTHPLDR